MTDQRRTVSIDITATDKLSGTLDSLAKKFQDLHNGLSGFNQSITPLVNGLSSITVPAGFDSFVSSLKKLDGVKPPDMSKFASGMEKLQSVGEIKNLSSVATELSKLDKIKVPGVLQLAVGLEKLSGASINVSTAASAIKGIIGPLERLAKIEIPKIKSLADGLSTLSTTVISSATSTSIVQFVNALATLNGVKIPDMKRFAAGISEIGAVKDLSQVTNNLQNLANSLNLFKNVKVPGVYQLALGFKALEQIDVAKITQNITSLANAISILEKSGTLKNFATFAADLRTLQGQISAITPQLTNLQNGVAKVGRSADDSGRKVKGFGERLVNYIQYRFIADSIMQMQDAFTGALKVITEYDQSLKDLQAITGATAAEVSIMGEKILEVAKATKFSASEVAGGMVILGQAGLSASEAVNTIGAVSDLATGTLSDMATTVDLVSTALNVFGIEANRSSQVADVFANAVNKSKLTMEKLRTAFNYVGPIAKDAGVTFEESAASMMVLANAGQRASTIGTGLRLMFSNLVDPPKKLADAVDKAGLSLNDLDPRAVGLKTVLQNLDLVIDGAGMAFDIFGKRGAAAVLALKDSGGGFQEMMETVTKTGTAAAMAAIQVEGLGVIFKNLKDRVQVLAISLGNAGISDILRGIGKSAQAAVEAMDVFVNSAIGGFIAKSALFVFSASTLVLVLGKLRTAFMAISAAYTMNVVAGAYLIANGAKISASSMLIGSTFKGMKASILGATAAIRTFITSGTLLSGIVTSLAFPLAVIAAQFIYAARSIDDFKKSSEEATKAAAKFNELRGGLSAYSTKTKDLTEGSLELKDANIALKKELLAVAAGNSELSISATLAANSIDSFDGSISDSGDALEKYKKQLNELEFSKISKSYADAVRDVSSQTGSLSRSVSWTASFFEGIAKNAAGNISVLLDASLDFSEPTAKAKRFGEEAKKSFDFSKSFADGKKSVKELSEYVAELDGLGFDNLSNQGKKLVTTFRNLEERTSALVVYLMDTNKISMDSLDIEIDGIARSMGLASNEADSLKMKIEALREAKSGFNSANAFLNEFADGVGKAVEGVDDYRENQRYLTDEQIENFKKIDAAAQAHAKKYDEIQQRYKEKSSIYGMEQVAADERAKAMYEWNDIARKIMAEGLEDAEYAAARESQIAKEKLFRQVTDIEELAKNENKSESYVREQKAKALLATGLELEAIQKKREKKQNEILLAGLDANKKTYDKANADRLHQIAIQEAKETTTHEKAEVLRLQSSLDRNVAELRDNEAKLAILKKQNTDAKDADVEKAQAAVDDSYIKVKQDEAAIELLILKQRIKADKDASKERLDNEKKAIKDREEAEADAKKKRKEAIDAEMEGLRLASREKLNFLEKERIEVGKMPNGVEKAEAELAINRKISEEKINLKIQEQKAIEAFEDSSRADKLKAEADVQAEITSKLKEGLADERNIANERIGMIGESWRQSAETIKQYRDAVTEAFELGLMSAKEYHDKMIKSGVDTIAALRAGFRESMDEMRTTSEMAFEIGSGLAGQMTDNFSTSFEEFVKGTKSASEAFSDFAIETMSWITKIIMRQLMLNAVMGIVNSLSGSSNYATTDPTGMVGLADGGSVPGYSPTPTSDNIPAWLTAEEFVHPVKAVRHYGTAFMEAIRTLRFPKSLALSMGSFSSIPRSFNLASGGMLPRNSSAYGSNGPVTNVTVINNTDTKATQSKKNNDQGGVDIEILIDSTVAKNIGRHGSASNKAIRSTTSSGPTLLRR